MTMKELESCIEAYGKDIYNFCLHLTRDRELAEDLYQDTFLIAIQKQKQIILFLFKKVVMVEKPLLI